MRAARLLLGALGVAVAAYGVGLLLARPPAQLIPAFSWLVGGVLVHDLLLVPVVLLLGAVGVRLLPAAARGPAAGVLVVLGTVTVAAVPVLGRFGARPDNPTLLDRDYTAGWLLLAALVLLAAALAVLLTRRRSRGTRPGR